ncbi:MAG: hypothetical protein ACP5R5_07845, partial [Armatimonadota bacterium]
SPTAEFNDLTTELTALSHLGDYYSHKLFAASIYALMVESSDVSLETPIRMELTAAASAWKKLAKIGDEHYKPFVDTLRMHTEQFTWSKQAESLPDDVKVLEETIAEIKASGKSGKAPMIAIDVDIERPEVVQCESALEAPAQASAPKKLTVKVKFANPDWLDKVSLKTKPFPSDKGDWTLTPMKRDGQFWVGEAEVEPEGLLWCIEALDVDGIGCTWPDFRKETPYRYVAPWNPGQ